MVNVGLSRTISESRKSQNFPTTFATPLKGFPLEIGIDAEDRKTRTMGLPGRQKRLTLSSTVTIECTNVTVRQTDDGNGRQQRPHSVVL